MKKKGGGGGVGKEEKRDGIPPLSTERIMVFLDEVDAVELSECLQVIHFDHVCRNRVEHIFDEESTLDGIPGVIVIICFVFVLGLKIMTDVSS